MLTSEKNRLAQLETDHAALQQKYEKLVRLLVAMLRQQGGRIELSVAELQLGLTEHEFIDTHQHENGVLSVRLIQPMPEVREDVTDAGADD